MPNPIVLTGDIHTNWVNDLRVDDHQPETPVIATEFVGTSISSGGDGADKLENSDAVLAENPSVRFFNSQRGYVRCTVTPRPVAERFPSASAGHAAGRTHVDAGLVCDRSGHAGRETGVDA